MYFVCVVSCYCVLIIVVVVIFIVVFLYLMYPHYLAVNLVKELLWITKFNGHL